jgi:hypothetical protein
MVKRYKMWDRVRDTRVAPLFPHRPGREVGTIIAVNMDPDPALARYRVRWDDGEREWTGPTSLDTEVQ